MYLLWLYFLPTCTLSLPLFLWMSNHLALSKGQPLPLSTGSHPGSPTQGHCSSNSSLPTESSPQICNMLLFSYLQKPPLTPTSPAAVLFSPSTYSQTAIWRVVYRLSLISPLCNTNLKQTLAINTPPQCFVEGTRVPSNSFFPWLLGHHSHLHPPYHSGYSFLDFFASFSSSPWTGSGEPQGSEPGSPGSTLTPLLISAHLVASNIIYTMFPYVDVSSLDFLPVP